MMLKNGGFPLRFYPPYIYSPPKPATSSKRAKSPEPNSPKPENGIIMWCGEMRGFEQDLTD
jgi:hypothetical protein